MVLLILAIAIFVVGGTIMTVATLRRSDRRNLKTGELDPRTKRADKKRRTQQRPATPSAASSGREIERLAVEARQRKDTDLDLVDEVLQPVPYVEPDADAIGVTRRQFLNRSVVGLMGFSLAGFGGSMLAFLWPSFSSGFGSKLNLGTVSDLQQQIRDNGGFFYVPEGRLWVTEYPQDAIEKARVTYSALELEGMEAGLVALYQKCPHLGCRVPECSSSQWFECPCHGSRYNRVGEKRGGPAPRGMDRFAMSVNSNGEFIVDTGTIIQGPAIGTNTTGQEAEGPNCIGQSSEE